MLQAKKLCRLQWHFPKGKYAVYLKITFFNKKYTTFFTMHFLKGNLLYYSAPKQHSAICYIRCIISKVSAESEEIEGPSLNPSKIASKLNLLIMLILKMFKSLHNTYAYQIENLFIK